MSDYKVKIGLNQSLLKKILDHPQNFLLAQKKYAQQLENKRNGIVESIPEHFLFGHIVDHKLTEDSDFEDSFYIVKDENNPSDKICEIINLFYNEYSNSGLLENHKQRLLEAAYKLDYGKSWKAETVVSKIIEGGKSYFQQLQKANNKIKITQSDYDKATLAVASLKSEVSTSYYLRKTKTVEIFKKPTIEFTFSNILFKGELDIVTVDHEKKIIFPVDVKTTSKPVHKFINEFWSYMYYFQPVIYTKGLLTHPIFKPLIDQGYTIGPFKFLVVEKDGFRKPMVYSITEEIMNLSINGGTLSNNKKVIGVKEAIMKYKYHLESNNWDYPSDYYQNGGEALITI